MSVLEALLRDIPLPRVVKVRQTFPAPRVADVPAAVRAALARPGLLDRVRPGMSVAIAVGSRGIRHIDVVTREVVAAVRAQGGDPFLVPAMGSHGGATAAGQTEVLAHLGITEATAGAPIRATMDVVQVGRLDNGLPVYVDAYAARADGIVVINRVKPHTAFRGRFESGLMKMLAIGLGKQKGAEACHQLGFGRMAEHVPAMGRIILARLPVLFGVALVENAYDETARVAALAADEIEQEEPALLEEAKALLPRLPFDEMDVLVIHEIGKDISGDGMDPNITGRYPTPYASGGPRVEKMVVLDVTDASQGNANGVGTADFTTQRLVDKMDRTATYANGLTSTVVGPTKIPMTLPCDRDAIRAAVKTCNRLDLDRVRLVYIRNTLHLGELYISESLLAETPRTQMEVVGTPAPIPFDAHGNITLSW
ncbi:hypothetical protein GCM10010885_11030 [Alicyclobacillus cellulosilyticus]|uniref:LarA-like N-terminal domain-containing protein n=1 Tax=Alicyclobacillus cellulosilyticus TaxID=1003997 RepID=A0A917K9N4_9BACL|nr:lactate racemase domain-containing protein [Alicyclobacillus cellulosilyticus]GGJ03522.1 hypothetical protein GCM10010885_11030 [Alicyclobacillus cellulosilyticus]